MKAYPVICAALSGVALSGCGDRQGSAEAAVALADATYPGQLELYDTHLQKGHYDVTLAVKGDRFTRIRFAVDRDPSACKAASPCEERLRLAYDRGIAAGQKLKALNVAMPACGIPMLGIQESHITPSFRVIIELALDPQDQQPGLDRLKPCIAAFRKALPADTGEEAQRLPFRILLPGTGAAADPKELLTFERRMENARADEPSYMVQAGPEEIAPLAENMRLYVHFLSKREIRDHLAGVARDALGKDRQGGHLVQPTFLLDTRLDAHRLDLVRTYVMACSVHEPGTGPCKPDIAVRLRYDLKSGQASPEGILKDIRDAKGNIQLPELPGR